MKIEKVNDNTIKCVLTTEELLKRQIKLSELCYGTDKIKALFRDMMTQAKNEFGFEIVGAPMMVEAVPMPDCLILLVSKVEEPEELDTRFSHFSSGGETMLPPPEPFGADSMLNLFNKLKDAKKLLSDEIKTPEDLAGIFGKPLKAPESGVQKPEPNGVPSGIPDIPIDILQFFKFKSIDDVIIPAKIVGDTYTGENSLYKVASPVPYRLVVHSRDTSPEVFNSVCNILSEYAEGAACTPAYEACIKEQDRTIIENDALLRLSTL